MNELEGGAGAIACSSGMSALHLALLAALLDRPKRVVAANALYGATTNLLMSIFGPMGVETTFRRRLRSGRVRRSRRRRPSPGAIVMETISNPLLRVGALDKIAEICERARARR